ncbi:hypothetical protein GCM10027074_67140 [Streptomyces deserti]
MTGIPPAGLDDQAHEPGHPCSVPRSLPAAVSQRLTVRTLMYESHTSCDYGAAICGVPSARRGRRCQPAKNSLLLHVYGSEF